MPRLLARRYDTQEISVFEWEQGRWRTVRAASPAELAGHSGKIPNLAPGLVDLQINGYGGREFTDPTLSLRAEHVVAVTQALAADGITAYAPTLTTNSFETLQHGLRILSEAFLATSEMQHCFAGIHLEGPYISAEDGPRGAHPAVHCRPHQWDEFQRFQEAAQGRIRILTMSPEFPGSCEFIERVAVSGVIVAIGHTAATCEQIRDAVSAGARMSTHLGNGAHTQLRRHPNYIWEQLADDRLMASLIADGHHLPPAVVQCFVRAKLPERCVLVSDITGLGGMPPGRYDTGLGSVEILDDGRMVVAGQRQLLAGAARPLYEGVANVMRFAGVELRTAFAMASTGPAQLAGLEVPRLEAGAPADFVLFDLAAEQLRILATYRRGVLAAGSAP